MKVTFLHMIRLFSTDPEIIAGRKLLVNEVYDELVYDLNFSLFSFDYTPIKNNFYNPSFEFFDL